MLRLGLIVVAVTLAAFFAVRALAPSGNGESVLEIETSPENGGSQEPAALTQDRVVEVRISGFQFQPTSLTIPAGTTVRFVNYDINPHNVTLPHILGPDLHEGDAWSVTFDEPGEYGYVCEYHHGMIGSIVVTP